MSKYSKVNFVYFMQKWMDSVPGQTFLNYAYSWGASVVILGTLFKLTHLPGANIALFLGMGTEVFVFFISAFDRPFDKSTIDMTLDNHMADDIQANGVPVGVVAAGAQTAAVVDGAEVGQTVAGGGYVVGGGPVVVGGQPVAGGSVVVGGQPVVMGGQTAPGIPESVATEQDKDVEPIGTVIIGEGAETLDEVQSTTENTVQMPQIGAPAPAVSVATAEAMEVATTAYVERLEQLNETLQKVEQLSSRLATDSEEMENLNRTLTGIARVYEMQLKSASQQITTQDSINEQTRIMSDKIKELNAIYSRMIEAMTVNMPKGA